MVYSVFVVISALTWFLFLLSYLDVTFGVNSKRWRPHICCFIFILLIFFLLLSNSSDYHFTCQGWERRCDVDVLFSANSIWVEESMALSEISNTVICLIKRSFCCPIGVFCKQVNFIRTEYNRDGCSIYLDNFVHFLFPLCGVLYWLRVRYICNHDNALGLTAEVSIKAFVCSVHPD